jgi:HlyD family secretion protein
MPTVTSNPGPTASFADDCITNHRSFAVIGYTAIGVVFGSLGLWSALAPLDAAAIAPAKVAVEGDRKPIQHLEGGIIQDILVKEAERVEQGQVLFRIDTTKARTTAETLRKQLDAALALEARLTAENAGLDRFAIPGPLEAKAHRPDVATALADQQRILDEHRRTLELQTAGLDARIRQAREDIGARESRLAGMRQQLASIVEEIGIVSGAAERGLYPRNKLRERERERARLDGEVGGISGEMLPRSPARCRCRQSL